ncbi:hypothetical protein LPTSP3_g28250 [Leptospira kobayashii]|uniref:Lipoprotein n=1 Tax=Leptospira kobayashii TaxID=1917830 RepID=A0ABM7ULQ4_9LEPT|nr:hypothetical protein [Leptospira kobayashii]BDA79895.1 hypothetical protein LPTSP3_g28250 [Leptospira kobayashii]
MGNLFKPFYISIFTLPFLWNCFTNPVFQDRSEREEEKRKKAIATSISLIGLNNLFQEMATPTKVGTTTSSANITEP